VIIYSAPLKLSNDFTAHVDVHDLNNPINFNGVWFEDFSGNRVRFNSEDHANGRVDMWRFWNTSSAGTEYESFRNKTCVGRQFTGIPNHGVFDFLKNAQNSSKCEKNGAVWSFTASSHKISLCAASIPKPTPYWLDYEQSAPKVHTITKWLSFTPGRPSPNNYVLPPNCKIN